MNLHYRRHLIVWNNEKELWELFGEYQGMMFFKLKQVTGFIDRNQ